MNEPTNTLTLTEMLRKALGADRRWAAEFLRTHADMPIAELADAIEVGAHTRTETGEKHAA